MSRLSATFSGFIVAYMLKEAGVTGVFGPITAAMLIVVIAMTLFGPNVRGKPLDVMWFVIASVAA
jgi:MFS transporter, putative metabolite:H+ symporter